MYYSLRKCIKSSDSKGWSYQMDEYFGKNKIYLSKFDTRPKRNNDEYRIYFEIKCGEVRFLEAYVVKGSGKRIPLSKENKNYIDATKILREFASVNYSKKRTVLTN